MEKYEIQKLRELPIEKVAKEMGMKVEHHKALCPFQIGRASCRERV